VKDYDLSVVVPTYNEVDNIALIVDAISNTLDGITSYEIIIVDDNSKDRTWELAEHLANKNENITSFRRVTAKGLSSAVIDGFMISKGEYVSVIDADLQHDESILVEMLNYCHNGADLVIGSRYCPDGSTGKLGTGRKIISKMATKLSQYISNVKMSDPMSGFFIIRKVIFLDVVDKLDGKGYKILLDIASQLESKDISIVEVPYTFKKRVSGDSKLSPEVIMQLIDFIYLRSIGKAIPIEYLKFITVGALGAIMHFTVLYIMHVLFTYPYHRSLIIAIESSLIINYFFNNIWTYKERIHTGYEKATGLLKFNILSGIGGIISYYMSINIYDLGINWGFASIGGAIVASLWNYNLNNSLTWGDLK
jgi:dolichol-phosphate mannosyltransferase